MHNYVTRFLVAKSGANTGTTLQTITAGDILFINGNDQSVLDTAAKLAAVSDNTPVYVAMGLALGKARLSFPIKRREIRKFTHEPFRAKVEQVLEFDTSSMVAGKIYRLIIVFKDDMRLLAERQTKLELIYTGTGDVTIDTAKLAAQVTKYKSTLGLLSGTVVGGKLRVTGLPVAAESVLDEYQFVVFSGSLVEEFDGTNGYPSISTGRILPVTVITKADGGSGNVAQLLKPELEASGYLGNTDLRNFDRLPASSKLAVGTNYDIFHLLHFDRHQGDHEFTMESPLQTTIVTPTGSSQATSVETLLKAFINKDASATTTSAPDPDDAGGV